MSELHTPLTLRILKINNKGLESCDGKKNVHCSCHHHYYYHYSILFFEILYAHLLGYVMANSLSFLARMLNLVLDAELPLIVKGMSSGFPGSILLKAATCNKGTKGNGCKDANFNLIDVWGQGLGTKNSSKNPLVCRYWLPNFFLANFCQKFCSVYQFHTLPRMPCFIQMPQMTFTPIATVTECFIQAYHIDHFRF